MTETTFHDPVVMLAGANREMRGIPNELLFNAPQYKMVRERWCAGMFGCGYARHVAPCKVATNELRYRQDIDLWLRTEDKDWDFQLAEIQEPGRRRGEEYRRVADGTVQTFPYEPERGRVAGPGWIAGAVERKRGKRYSGSESLHLLLYANFNGEQLEYADVAAALQPYEGDFGSIWIFTSLHICSVFSPPELGALPGWAQFRGFEDYYP